MGEKSSYEDLLRKNMALKQKLKYYREQLELYKQGFLSQEKTLLRQNMEHSLKILKNRKQLQTKKIEAFSYAQAKDWLLQEDFHTMKDTVMGLLERLTTEHPNDIFSLSFEEVLTKTKDLWGEQGPCAQDKERVQKMAVLFSLISATWENNL